MRIILSFIGAILFLLSVILGFVLLMAEKLNGTEFISLIVAFAVIGLIISFASEVQEFSVAGNIVKLKEVKSDAEKSIKELKSARTETFRFLLSLAQRPPGGLSNSGNIEEHIRDFWFLYNQIVSFKCEEPLTDNISSFINILIKEQLKCIALNSMDIKNKYCELDVLPEPSVLTIEALDNESVKEAANRRTGGDISRINKDLVAGLNEYKKLYELRAQYQ